jgi:hypothetical protein
MTNRLQFPTFLKCAFLFAVLSITIPIVSSASLFISPPVHFSPFSIHVVDDVYRHHSALFRLPGVPISHDLTTPHGFLVQMSWIFPRSRQSPQVLSVELWKAASSR